MAAAEQIFNGAAAQPQQIESETKRIRTIVVDDSPTFLEVTCELLELEPLVDVVARADTGGEAIETVMKLQPDLVLMDVHMLYLDGLTLAWFFRQRFPFAQVVLMSADNTPELREACADSGVLDFVHKENFRQEFAAILQRICPASEGGKSVFRRAIILCRNNGENEQ